MECINSQVTDKGTETISKYVILSVSGYPYAIKVSYVYKVMELPCVSPLPCVKPHILGVTKVDGNVYTVVDLRILFGAEPKVFSQCTKVVLMSFEESKICAVVDDVISITGIDINSVMHPFHEQCYVYGVVQIDGEIICLLSIENLFNGIRGLKSML